MCLYTCMCIYIHSTCKHMHWRENKNERKRPKTFEENRNRSSQRSILQVKDSCCSKTLFLYFSFFIKTKCKSELGMTQIKILMQKHVVSQQVFGAQKWTQTQKKQIIQKDLEKITFPRTDTGSCWHHNSDLQYFVYRIRSFKHRGSNIIWLMQLNEQLWSICVAHWMIKWVYKIIIIIWSLLTMPLSEFSSLFLTETK